MAPYQGVVKWLLNEGGNGDVLPATSKEGKWLHNPWLHNPCYIIEK